MSLPSLCHLPQGPLGAKAQEVPWSCKATRKTSFLQMRGVSPEQGRNLAKDLCSGPLSPTLRMGAGA